MPPTQPPVGIDLGTTFSVVAYVDALGRPTTIPNAEGDLTTPSVVLFEGGRPIVGKEAYKAASLEPEKVAQFAKREMGRPAFSRTIDGESYPPEVIQSMILAKLKSDAERVIGPVRDVVITVPAYFTEPRRKATQDAGRIAGLNVLDIVNEPTAAAISYGVQQGFLDPSGAAVRDEKVLIYDLGGGTFDVTVMSIVGNRYTVIATDGDVMLGGIDWDRAIADFVGGKFLETHGVDPRVDPAGMQRLLREAEEAKRALSGRDHYVISVEHRGQGVRVPMSRSLFIELTAALLDRTRHTVQAVLDEAGLDWTDLTRILPVGGSTRMPMVSEMLEAASGMKVDVSLSADEAVAHGAAIYASLRRSDGVQRPDMEVVNVNSHNLGVMATEIATGRPRNEVLIAKNSPLPTKARRRFHLAHANQRSVEVRVVEGGDASGNDATPIGRCVVRGLPPELPKESRVVVEFEYETNGRLTVRASLTGIADRSASEAKLEVVRNSGMSRDELDAWSHRVGTPLTVDDSVARQDERGDGSTMTLEETANRGEPSDDVEKAGFAPPEFGESQIDPEPIVVGGASSESDVVDRRLRKAEEILVSGAGEAEVMQALAEIEAALAVAPQSASVLASALRVASHAGLTESIVEYAHRLEAAPDATTEHRRDAYLAMGWAYMDVQMYDDASEPLERAVALDGSDAEALAALAECRWRTGRLDEARELSERNLRLVPDTEICRRILRGDAAF